MVQGKQDLVLKLSRWKETLRKGQFTYFHRKGQKSRGKDVD